MRVDKGNKGRQKQSRDNVVHAIRLINPLGKAVLAEGLQFKDVGISKPSLSGTETLKGHLMDSIHFNETSSVWHNRKDSVYLPPLDHNIEADVCIVGAGIAGLTTAYLLLQEGLDVVILEKSTFCKGQSGRSTAHLTAVLDERYCDLEEIHGSDTTRLVANSQLEALALIKKIVICGPRVR